MHYAFSEFNVIWQENMKMFMWPSSYVFANVVHSKLNYSSDLNRVSISILFIFSNNPTFHAFYMSDNESVVIMGPIKNPKRCWFVRNNKLYVIESRKKFHVHIK